MSVEVENLKPYTDVMIYGGSVSAIDMEQERELVEERYTERPPARKAYTPTMSVELRALITDGLFDSSKFLNYNKNGLLLYTSEFNIVCEIQPSI